MKIRYKGKYNGDPASLPQREHPEGAVQFREPDDMKRIALLMNALALAIVLVLCVAVELIAEVEWWDCIVGLLLVYVTALPHEFLHAIWFREGVEVYTNLKQGMLFVIGTEDLSKSRFVFLSLFPNLVFGFLPFVLFLLFPNLVILGVMGAANIGAGAGDYMNVFNCLTQVPKGAKVYNSGMHTYWYL